MGSERGRDTRLLPALGIGLLALLVLVVLGWAVVGKHHLDPQARHVYKCTRLIVGERPEQAAPPTASGVEYSDGFPSIQVVRRDLRTPLVLPPRRDLRHPCRAPPKA